MNNRIVPLKVAAAGMAVVAAVVNLVVAVRAAAESAGGVVVAAEVGVAEVGVAASIKVGIQAAEVRGISRGPASIRR